MAYRITINGIQLFGNNESYPEWDNFIRSQGISINADGAYDGTITDFMGAMTVCEQIVMNLEKERSKNLTLKEEMIKAGTLTEQELQEAGDRYGTRSLFDLTPIRDMVADKTKCQTLFDSLYWQISDGYLFIPIVLYHACKKDLQLDMSAGKNDPHAHYYTLKKGRRIHVHAG